MIRRSALGALLMILLLTTSIVSAQRNDVPEYGQRGEYAVGTFEFTINADTDRPLNGTIWYPADAEPSAEPSISYNIALVFGVQGNAYQDAAPNITDGPYPLVVYTHGSFGSRVYSLWLTEHLASHGFVVMAIDHPDNSLATNLTTPQNHARSFALRTSEISQQIDYAEALNAQGGALEGVIDLQKVGVIGYSLGAVNTLEIAGARLNFDDLATYCEQATVADEQNVCETRRYASQIATLRGLESIPNGNWNSHADPRVDAIAVFAPWNGVSVDVSTVSVPTFVAVGTNDQVAVPERDAFRIYDTLNTTRYMASMALGGHVLFVDECAPVHDVYQIWDACTDPVWDLERAHDILNHLTTSFFLTHLMDDEAAETNLIDYEAVGVDVVHNRPSVPLRNMLLAAQQNP